MNVVNTTCNEVLSSMCSGNGPTFLRTQNEHPITAEKGHQFDFWIGEWYVDLQIQPKIEANANKYSFVWG